MANIIEFHNVSKRYPGGQTALREITLGLARGELAFLTGHSGAGKSTLLKLIALIERPTRGQVIINGKNLIGVRRRQIPLYRQRLGIIFQDYNLLYDRNVFDNVAVPLIIRGLTPDSIARRVRAALDTVGLLGKERAAPITLSGGEQQRVAIARAVVGKPYLILADEPTGNLDPELSAEIMRLFERLNETGTTVLIATHDLALINRLEHRIIELKGGEFVNPGHEPAAGAA